MARRKRARREFGAIDQLPSGRWRARYRLPDGSWHKAPHTFPGIRSAEDWLAVERAKVIRERDAGTPRTGRPRGERFADYAEKWLAQRSSELKPRTVADYQRMLDAYLLPTFADVMLAKITPAMVRAWHADLGHQTGPTQRARAYQLLSVIMRTAWKDELIPSSPCRIEGAAHVERARSISVATPDEVTALVRATPERYRLFVLLAAWCQLRQGELAELRRKDVDLAAGTVRVERGVTRVKGQQVVGTPKSKAGRRVVSIPPPLLPAVVDHLERFAQPGPEGLLFPSDHGRQLQPSTIYRWYYPARAAAGRPDLRLHDLRHTGAVYLAQKGATLAELMARLGHSTPQAAMIYQHAASGRDAELAGRLGALIRL